MYGILYSLSLAHFFFLLFKGFKIHCVFYSYRTSSFELGSIQMLRSHMGPETVLSSVWLGEDASQCYREIFVLPMYF